jgi:hypothetical protein
MEWAWARHGKAWQEHFCAAVPPPLALGNVHPYFKIGRHQKSNIVTAERCSDCSDSTVQAAQRSSPDTGTPGLGKGSCSGALKCPCDWLVERWESGVGVGVAPLRCCTRVVSGFGSGGLALAGVRLSRSSSSPVSGPDCNWPVT